LTGFEAVRRNPNYPDCPPWIRVSDDPATDTRRRTIPKACHEPKLKLEDDEQARICAMLDSGMSIISISKETGRARSTIARVRDKWKAART